MTNSDEKIKKPASEEIAKIEKEITTHENPATEIVMRALYDFLCEWSEKLDSEEWEDYDEIDTDTKAGLQAKAEKILSDIDNLD